LSPPQDPTGPPSSTNTLPPPYIDIARLRRAPSTQAAGYPAGDPRQTSPPTDTPHRHTLHYPAVRHRLLPGAPRGYPARTVERGLLASYPDGLTRSARHRIIRHPSRRRDIARFLEVPPPQIFTVESPNRQSRSPASPPALPGSDHAGRSLRRAWTRTCRGVPAAYPAAGWRPGPAHLKSTSPAPGRARTQASALDGQAGHSAANPQSPGAPTLGALMYRPHLFHTDPRLHTLARGETAGRPAIRVGSGTNMCHQTARPISTSPATSRYPDRSRQERGGGRPRWRCWSYTEVRHCQRDTPHLTGTVVCVVGNPETQVRPCRLTRTVREISVNRHDRTREVGNSVAGGRLVVLWDTPRPTGLLSSTTVCMLDLETPSPTTPCYPDGRAGQKATPPNDPPKADRSSGGTNLAGAGLRSAARNNKATRLLIRPDQATKSSAKDLSPHTVKLQYASWRG
jgi:hypothetical protein